MLIICIDKANNQGNLNAIHKLKNTYVKFCKKVMYF